MMDSIEDSFKKFERNNFYGGERGMMHTIDYTFSEKIIAKIQKDVVFFTDGTVLKFKGGKLHREDGPAVEYANGRKEWWINGKLHREDGPAVEYADGINEYYYHGYKYNSL